MVWIDTLQVILVQNNVVSIMGLQDVEAADECHLLGTSFKTFMDVFINNGSPKLYFWKSNTHFVVSKPGPNLRRYNYVQ